MEESGGPMGAEEVGEIAVTTYNTSIWSSPATKIYLDSNITGGLYFYKIILAAMESPEVYTVTSIIPSGTAYTFNETTDAYSIHVASDNKTGHAAVTALGIQVGDLVTFPGTNLSTLSDGDQSILVTIWRMAD
jgi:hypothetical protein